MSQLELATTSGVSQRHLSFVETGRSQPSRELVLHLANTLEVPLREQNVLLQAAGFAARFKESALDDQSVAPVKRALELLLDNHEPFPAVVIDRYWNLVMANSAAGSLTASVPPEVAEASGGNLLRLMIHPDGLGRFIVNRDEVAAATMLRVERERSAFPDDTRLADLVDEVRGHVDPQESAHTLAATAEVPFVIPVHVRLGDVDIRMFSTLVTIGSPLDITVQELVAELFFPADESSEAALRRLSA